MKKHIKRLCSLVLIVSCLFSLAACVVSEKSASSKSSSSLNNYSSVEESSEEESSFIENSDTDITKYKAGTYKIGRDLPEGVYILLSENGRGYYSISSDENCKNILDNDNFGSITYLTAYEDTYLYFARSVAIPYSDELIFNPVKKGEITGTFKVGKDIPVGEYVLISENSNGYFAILSGTAESEILANDNFGYITYVKAVEGTCLTLRRCKILSYSARDVYNPVDNSYVNGTYKVGKDLPAGRYKLSAISSGYYAIYNTPQGKIVANKFFQSGSVYITVQEGQYITLSKVKVEVA